MLIDHFSVIAGLYNKLARYKPSSRLLDLLSLSPDHLMLDAGGGTGHFASAIRGMVKGVIVADSAHAMLRHAISKGLDTVCTPVEELPFSSNTFNRIIMMDTLHHVVDQQKTINELWRVLTPGGHLVLVEPDIHKFPVKIIAIIEKILLMRSHFIDDRKITHILSNLFTKIQVLHNKENIWVSAEKEREL